MTRAGWISGAPAARRPLELLAWAATEADAYPYQAEIERREGARVLVGGRWMLMLSSYDYLGLLGHRAIEDAAVAAVREYGTGAGGVRLLTGTTRLHRDLERRIAAFKRVEAAATFSSGYLANLAAIATFFGPGDRVLLDSLAHRSIVDAVAQARLRPRRFRHNDLADLERRLAMPCAGKTLVIVEGVYSMDGDVPPLRELVALKRRHGFQLMVDEAHSLGVLGDDGRGIDELAGVDPADVDIWTGSLSKAIPSTGGYVAGSGELAVVLQHASAPFIFSAAACPASVAAALAAFDVIEAEPERRVRLHESAAMLRRGLRDAGLDAGASTTPIVPVKVGGELECFRLAASLRRDHGILVNPIIHPAVPLGAARLRLCATAAIERADLARAVDALAAPPPSRKVATA